MASSKGRRITAAVSVAVLMAAAAGCTTQDTPEQLLAKARQFEQAGNHKAAVIELKNALAQNGSLMEARALLARVYLDSGDAASAEKEARRAMDLGWDRKSGVPVLGRALLLQGQSQKLLDETVPEKDVPEIMALRGAALLRLQKPDEAKNVFDVALQAQPGLPEALMGLSQTAIAKQDQPGAARYIQEAVDKNPKNSEVWMFKSQLARMQGKPDDALAALDQALALNTDNMDARLQKASVLIQEKKFDAAKAEIAAARKAKPNDILINYVQAFLDFSQANYAAARDGLQKVLAVASEHQPSILLAGASQFALGSMPQAEQHLKKYIESNAQDWYARKLLASVYLNTGRPKDALAMVQAQLQGSTDPLLLKIAGRASMEMRDFAQASAYYERASKLNPTAADLHTALGASKLGLGQVDEGLAQMETATRLDSTSLDAGFALALTQLRLQQFDKALLTVQGMQRAHPNDPMLYNLEGGIYLGQKKLPQARATFDKALQIKGDYFPAISNLAQLDMTEKKPAEAKARLAAFVDKNKGAVDAMDLLAQIAQAEKNPGEATRWLERAHQVDPKAIRPAVRLIEQYVAAKDLPKALTLARNTQVSHADNPELLGLLAKVQLASQDKSGALESYNKLAVLQPTEAVVQYRLASVHALMDNVPAATDGLRKALKLKPDFMEAQLALAELERRQGNYDRGLGLAQQMQKQPNTKKAGYALEGDLQTARGKPELGLKAYAAAVELGKQGDGPLLVKLAEALRRSGKQGEALAKTQAWLKVYPGDTLVSIFLSEIYIGEKKYPLAVDEQQRRLKQAPGNAGALNNLAWAYHQMNDARALPTAEEAYKIAPESAPVMDTLGWILVEQGQAARGLPLIQKALAAEPGTAETRYHLASALVKTNDKAGARKELERLLSGDKDFASKAAAQALLKQL